MFAPSVDTRIDWFRLLCQLKEEGYSLYAVAHFTEIPKSTLIGYKHGTEPGHHNGERLLQFWMQTMSKGEDEAPKTRDDAPKINPFSYKA